MTRFFFIFTREVAVMAGVNLPGESGTLGTDEYTESLVAQEELFSENDSNENVGDEDFNSLTALKKSQKQGRDLRREMKKVSARSSHIRFL
jgi:hypothetical protein